MHGVCRSTAVPPDTPMCYKTNAMLNEDALIILSHGSQDIPAPVLPKDVTDAFDVAYSNIKTFHEAQQSTPMEVETMPGVRCRRVTRPIGETPLTTPRLHHHQRMKPHSPHGACNASGLCTMLMMYDSIPWAPMGNPVLLSNY